MYCASFAYDVVSRVQCEERQMTRRRTARRASHRVGTPHHVGRGSTLHGATFERATFAHWDELAVWLAATHAETARHDQRAAGTDRLDRRDDSGPIPPPLHASGATSRDLSRLAQQHRASTGGSSCRNDVTVCATLRKRSQLASSTIDPLHCPPQTTTVGCDSTYYTAAPLQQAIVHSTLQTRCLLSLLHRSTPHCQPWLSPPPRRVTPSPFPAHTPSLQPPSTTTSLTPTQRLQ